MIPTNGFLKDSTTYINKYHRRKEDKFSVGTLYPGEPISRISEIVDGVILESKVTQE